MTDRLTTYDHDGLTFDVRDEGPRDGDPVVLLHGFPERGTSWREVAPRLHGAGLRTYAPDQRGYSPGARPSRRRDYGMPLLVADTVALVEEIDRPVHLVGHDWGAVVAWRLAVERPDLVRSLTAVSVPHPAAFLRAIGTSTQVLRSWYVGLFQVPLAPELVAALPGRPFEHALRHSGMTDEDVERFRTEIVEYGALPGALGWYRAMPLGDPRPMTQRVSVPTTLVWSDGDVAVARQGAELSGQWVDAPYRFEVLEGVSHWIPTHAPEALAAAVLDRVESTGPVA
jgi:pimeloyl-ACP methyl ester carboxylesterase